MNRYSMPINISAQKFFRLLVVGVLLAFTFVCIFGSSYVNGDDIDHVIGHHGRSVFLPETSVRWIPNRIFDQYIRGLLGEFFVLLSVSFQNFDFAFAYRVLNGLMYAVFLFGSVEYFVNRSGYFVKNNQKNVAFFWVSYILLWGVLFWVLRWRNQTHFICYQIPSMLTFFFVLEFYFNLKDEVSSKLSVAGMALLLYVISFSLEAYAFELLLFFALYLLLIRKRPDFCTNSNHISRLIYFFLLLPLSALLITVFFSSRASMVEFAMGMSHLEIFKNLTSGLFLLLFLAASLFLIFLVRTRKSNNAYSIAACYCIAIISSVVSVALISYRSGYNNYFDMIQYPWGDLILPLKISCVFATFVFIDWLFVNKKIWQPVLLIVFFVLASTVFSKTIKYVKSDAAFSYKVQKYYKYSSSECQSSIDTGLNLIAIPTQTRPLPTGTEHGGALNHYKEFFAMYYGHSCMPWFQ